MIRLYPYCYCGLYALGDYCKSYRNLEWPSVHYDLLPHVKVLHGVEQVIFRGRLVDAVTTNKSTYIRTCI